MKQVVHHDHIELLLLASLEILDLDRVDTEDLGEKRWSIGLHLVVEESRGECEKRVEFRVTKFGDLHSKRCVSCCDCIV